MKSIQESLKDYWGTYLYLSFTGEDFQLFEDWGKEISKNWKYQNVRKDRLGEEDRKPKEPKLKVSGNAILRLFLTPRIQNFGSCYCDRCQQEESTNYPWLGHPKETAVNNNPLDATLSYSPV